MPRFVVSVTGHKTETDKHTIANEVLVCTREHQLAAEVAGFSAFYRANPGYAVDTLVVLDITHEIEPLHRAAPKSPR